MRYKEQEGDLKMCARVWWEMRWRMGSFVGHE